jgi:hypothetical protein
MDDYGDDEDNNDASICYVYCSTPFTSRRPAATSPKR